MRSDARADDVGYLLHRVALAAGVDLDKATPKHWMRPTATIEVGRWVTDLGLGDGMRTPDARAHWVKNLADDDPRIAQLRETRDRNPLVSAARATASRQTD